MNENQNEEQIARCLERIHDKLNHIFDVMGPIRVIGHCKDIRVRDGFVVHFDEEIPGQGELDLATALRR